MNMAVDATELDRLIEEGLTLYGQGNLDGALLVWEQVLSVDPENAQASSYVDYVRMNYELLTGDLGDEDGGPFAIASDEEPEYQIEIVIPSEPPAVAQPLHMDPVDEGWFIGDDRGPPPPAPAPIEVAEAADAAESVMTLELEADEPPLESAEQSFDDPTTEFEQHAHTHGEFAPEATPGFGNELTDVRRRDLGFVKPTAPELPEPPRRPQHGDEIETAELGPAGRSEPSTFDRSYAALDLPTVQTAAAPQIDDDPPIELANPMHTTMDLPTNLVPPHERAAFDAIELDEPVEPPSSIHGAPTRELGTRELGMAFSSTQTIDFGDKPTTEVDRSSFTQPDPLISAPTRELGLRTSGVTGRAPTEDQPTLTISKSLSPAAIDYDPDGTRGDIILPFDPIDARTALILEQVDRAAPANEEREDKTRRRITALVEQAQVWAAGSELDKAVAAIDLALAEDPNSALAQKLIHRNRDTIMSVFQGFLGNLDRQPSLARPLHELGSAPISPRAAFLLSRVDGSLTLDEILDVSGMPRLEAYRYLCQLFLRGILR
jgi:hypothetical protein